MAGDWIKFELITLDKPEVCQIADLADIDSDAAVGKLLRVWGWFDQQTEDGNAPSVSKRLLDRMVGVTGFCEHMKSVGWMFEDDGVISLPNFARHNGKTAKNRLLTAKRVANHKASNGKGNARSVSDALPKEDVEKSKEQTPHTPASRPVADVASAPVATDGPFLMTLDWEPDQKTLTTLALCAGLPPEVVTRDAIGGFKVHHSTSGVTKTGGQWHSALVNWIKRDHVRDARVVRFPGGGQRKANGPDFDDLSWAEDLGDL